MSAVCLKEDVRNLILDLRQMKSFCEDPMIVERAKDIYLFDIDGKRYIDGISGIYTVNIGHGNEYVLDSIRRQHEKVCFVAPMHGVSDTAVRYSNRLTEITPEGLNTIKLLSGGSEATESAIKFMRQYHRQTGNPFKYKVISLYKGFHGGTFGAMSATGLSGPRKSVFGPFLEGFIHIAPPKCFGCHYDLNYPSCDLLCAKMLEQTIVNEGPESVGAFIVEPIGNTGGIVTSPPEYLPMVRKICSKYNVLLIFDEIITGMGRTGNWFAAHTFKTTPDLLCVGKGLSSGYAPLAALVVRDELYYSAFWGEETANIHFAHGHTYGANPISAAAGLAVIDVMEKENLIRQGTEIGNYIRNRLERDVAELGVMGDVRGKGCLACVEFVQNMESGEAFPPERRFGKVLERRLMKAGLILRCDPDWIAFAPPLITTIGQAEEILDIFFHCLKEELKQPSHNIQLYFEENEAK